MKVLVLTRSTGEGHNRVAHALHESFDAHGHVCEVKDALCVANRDSVVFADPDHEATTRSSSDVASQLYGWAALKMPHLFGAVYSVGDLYSRTGIPSPVYAHNARFAEATHSHIEEHAYDAVVATHLFPQETLAAVRRRHPSRARFYGVLTDYSCTPFFSEPDIDGYFIPHEDMRDDCLRHRLSKEKTYVSGIPVAARFRHVSDRTKARESLGLPQDLPIFLVMAGGVGSPHTHKVCDRLLSEGGEGMRLVVLTGRNQDLFTGVAKRYGYDPRVTVVPFTDRVDDYMAASDVLLSKPGAVSSTEAAVVGLPLVHTGAIPGGEVKNARFFAERGMSVYSQRVSEAARLSRWLLSDAAGLARMRQNQARNVVEDAADRIVAQVEKDQESRMGRPAA